MSKTHGLLEATQRAAEQVLGYHQKQLETHEFIVEHVLVGFIRPLFSDSQTTSVTSQGRKAISQTVQKPHHLHDLDAIQKAMEVQGSLRDDCIKMGYQEYGCEELSNKRPITR